MLTQGSRVAQEVNFNHKMLKDEMVFRFLTQYDQNLHVSIHSVSDKLP